VGVARSGTGFQPVASENTECPSMGLTPLAVEA
jgi:hypothetical protein